MVYRVFYYQDVLGLMIAYEGEDRTAAVDMYHHLIEYEDVASATFEETKWEVVESYKRSCSARPHHEQL